MQSGRREVVRKVIMEHLVEEAFRVAIVNELKSQHLLWTAAAAMPAGNCKTVLERLAGEESKLVEQMMERYPYPLSGVVAKEEAPRDCSGRLSVEQNGAGISNEQNLVKVLRSALHDKYVCVARYQTFIDSFRDPEVCGVFQLAIDMSRDLLEAIAEEYRRADVRHQPAVVRRAKRTHIRTTFSKPAPNRHSQLYLSLRDLP